MSLLRSAILATLVVLLGPGAGAHELKAALTEVLYNPRSDQLEVAHRFIIHDAEHAIAATTGRQVDLAFDADARDAFAQHVANHFTLAKGDRQIIDLTLLGSQIDNGYIWVYQEAPLNMVDADTLVIRHDALRERWPDQVNMVNIRKGKDVRSLRFAGADKFKRIRLGQD